MTTLEEIFNRDDVRKKFFKKDKIDKYQEENKEELKSYKLDCWKPFEIKDFILPEFKIPVEHSNNSKKAKCERLSKILAFIEIVQHKRIKYGCTAMPIPTTARKNLRIWGNPKEISRAIAYMKEIGLITVYDDKYRFGCAYEGGNYGKTYAYYVENEEKVIQYCKDNNIHKYIVDPIVEAKTERDCKKLEEKIEPINRSKAFSVSEVKFSPNLRLEKPEGISKSDFEIFLTLCLYENYPEFKLMQYKVKEINEHYKDYPEFAIIFEPHFKWGKKENTNKIVKISIRATNDYCNKEKSERAEILKAYGFNLQKDIRSSVPRLTYAINKGKWLEETVDIYKLINDEFDPGSIFTEERREAIKYYHLVTYFFDGSDKELGRNVLNKKDSEGIVKAEVDELMGRLKKAALKVEGGKFYGSEIFYVESWVYLMTVYDLLSAGFKVWLVYDAFYAKGRVDQKIFTEMIERMVALNFRFFMEHSKINSDYKELTIEDENCKKIMVAEIIEKYKKLGSI